MSHPIQPLLVKMNLSIKQAMKQLEATAQKILFVVSETNELIGALTDGDIRRWILSEGGLDADVEQVCNRTPYAVSRDYDIHAVKRVMLERNINCVPVLDENLQVVDLLHWEEVFWDAVVSRTVRPVNLPVVIMAGGKGTRLDPFTRILPKPLVPIGEKTVIEIIMESFFECGVDHFYISVNHKHKIIRSYFEELQPPYTIEYIHEAKPLGTAGSLKYLQGKISGSFLVTNCDVIIKTDYATLVDHHLENGNDITLVASLKNFHIPYGICEIENGGRLTGITEKPEYSLLVNTGMYILRADTLKFIPDDELFHITDLIEKVRGNGMKIGVFPIGENAWLDTGEWSEYRKAVQQFSC